MLQQIFRSNIQSEKLFGLLELCCIKYEKYYLFDNNAFRKMIYNNQHISFLEGILNNYHLSKQFYVTRKITHNSFVNIIRQICKSNEIMYNSQIKYNESKYNIDYLIYF